MTLLFLRNIYLHCCDDLFNFTKVSTNYNINTQEILIKFNGKIYNNNNNKSFCMDNILNSNHFFKKHQYKWKNKLCLYSDFTWLWDYYSTSHGELQEIPGGSPRHLQGIPCKGQDPLTGLQGELQMILAGWQSLHRRHTRVVIRLSITTWSYEGVFFNIKIIWKSIFLIVSNTIRCHSSQ